jgi:hypothetical protein
VAIVTLMMGMARIVVATRVIAIAPLVPMSIALRVNFQFGMITSETGQERIRVGRVLLKNSR